MGDRLDTLIPGEYIGRKLEITIIPFEEKRRGKTDALKKPKYNLKKLLAGVNKDNLHEEVSFGKLKGKEQW